MQNLTCRNKRL